MSHQSELIAEDIEAYLTEHENKELLRFITCGSVDDGKSTLIGRLLHDSKIIYEDQLAALHADNERVGNAGEELDLALLVDGLQAEREQGITIDVAYRYFSTTRRKFIIADTPGHEQYTRNMVTGASTADLAIILIDARSGVLVQTRRHSYLVSLLGIKHAIVAINKMDLVDYDEARFNEIKSEYLAFAKQLNIPDITFIPLSALKGDNVVSASEDMPWYTGQPLMESLETIEISDDCNLEQLRFPVQYVNRPNLDFRGYCGTLTAGIVKPGDSVTALPSGKTSRVSSITTYDGELDQAYPPMSVTLTLEDEIDISRGDIIVSSADIPKLKDRFTATVVWMSEQSFQPGRQYDIKIGALTIAGSISKIHHRVDVNTLEHHTATVVALNEIVLCDVNVERPVVVDNYVEHRGTGAFIIIDRLTNATVAAGMMTESDSQTDVIVDIIEQSAIKKAEWSARLGQEAGLVQIIGGNETQTSQLLYTLEKQLFTQGRIVFVVGPAQLPGIGKQKLVEALLDKSCLVLTNEPLPKIEAGVASLVVDLGETKSTSEHLEFITQWLVNKNYL